jgi:hypothetical protein
MARREDLFHLDGLLAPEPSPALADLFCVLMRLRCHPIAVELGFDKQRQIWELHRLLHNVPDVIVELLAEHCVEEDCIPLLREIQPLVRTCWRTWDELAALGMRIDQEYEPELPPAPPRCWRVLRRNVDRLHGRPDDDDH